MTPHSTNCGGSKKSMLPGYRKAHAKDVQQAAGNTERPASSTAKTPAYAGVFEQRWRSAAVRITTSFVDM